MQPSVTFAKQVFNKFNTRIFFPFSKLFKALFVLTSISQANKLEKLQIMFQNVSLLIGNLWMSHLWKFVFCFAFHA